jgi:hypothetical protein
MLRSRIRSRLPSNRSLHSRANGTPRYVTSSRLASRWSCHELSCSTQPPGRTSATSRDLRGRVQHHHEVRRLRPRRVARDRSPGSRTTWPAPGCWTGTGSSRSPGPHAEDGLEQQPVGAGGAGAVDGGDLEGEVDLEGEGVGERTSLTSSLRTRHLQAARWSAARSPEVEVEVGGAPAYGISRSYFRMSNAAVGQRSAQRPQWMQRSSSLTMTRPVWGRPRTRRWAGPG